MQNKLRVLSSEDGSSTIMCEDLQETYHSVHGAVQESLHVFIKAGLQKFLSLHPQRKQIRILEIGFGTGLNALLSFREAQTAKVSLWYHAIDKYPLPPEILAKLNYGEVLSCEALYSEIKEAAWNRINPVAAHQLFLEKLDLSEFRSSYQYDLIFFDAFSPDKQPALWSPAVFDNLFAHTVPAGILTTYSAKGQVRRNMQAAGFRVERIAGPPGKREMLRATKVDV